MKLAFEFCHRKGLLSKHRKRDGIARMSPLPIPSRTNPTSRLLGRGCYVDDVQLADALHLAFVRSPVACGQITHLDMSDAAATKGVVAVHTGLDVAHLGDLTVNPLIQIKHLPRFTVLAPGHVGSVGQPIAAILAQSAVQAQQATDLVDLDIKEPQVRPPGNLIAEAQISSGNCMSAFARADQVVRCSIQHPRLAPNPMEPRGSAVRYDPDSGGITVWQSTQTPHRSRAELAKILDVDPDLIRVIAPDTGGAFGLKGSIYPEEVFAAWAALHHRRSVKWIATRSEEFLSAAHGRGLASTGELALDENGIFLGLSAEISAPLGQWLPNSALVPAWNAARILPSGYDIPNVDVKTCARTQYRAPVGIYRGAGRPEANALIERLVDKAARATEMDPFEIRKRNLLATGALPFALPSGDQLDSGDYLAALDRLRAVSDYASLQNARDQRRANGALSGIGIAFCLEPSGSGFESARVTLDKNGNLHIASGSSSQGHNRTRAYTRIASATLGIAPDQISVSFGDTATDPAGIGAVASRATAIGGSAVLEACQQIKAQRKQGQNKPLQAEIRYENKGQAWGFGAYLVTAEIDADTGEMTLEHAFCVDDAGTIIDMDAVKGQLIGGFAQGLGEALLESVHYDEADQLLTGSFMDYAMPRATDMPPLSIHNLQSPSPMNSLGAKGVGEAGTIGAPIAILNAALDALAPLGITDLDMPLTPCKIWHAIQAARKGQT